MKTCPICHATRDDEIESCPSGHDEPPKITTTGKATLEELERLRAEVERLSSTILGVEGHLNKAGITQVAGGEFEVGPISRTAFLVQARDSALATITELRERVKTANHECAEAIKSRNSYVIAAQDHFKQVETLKARVKTLEKAFDFPEITKGNAKAISFHVSNGEPFGGLNPDALVAWLDAVADGLDRFNTALQPTAPTEPEKAGSVAVQWCGSPVDFREWWDSKDWTFGGDATPFAVAGMAWEAAYEKYVLLKPTETPAEPQPATVPLALAEGLYDALEEATGTLESDNSHSDSYGVEGSSFGVCDLCDAEDRPGIFSEGIPHDASCFIYKLRQALTAYRANHPKP